MSSISTCEVANLTWPHEAVLSQNLLFLSILPFLLKGRLHGGHPTYIIYVHDGHFQESSSIVKFVNLGCTDWLSEAYELQYPSDVTDVLILVQCAASEATVSVRKVTDNLCSKISLFLRPTVSLVYLNLTEYAWTEVTLKTRNSACSTFISHIVSIENVAQTLSPCPVRLQYRMMVAGTHSTPSQFVCLPSQWTMDSVFNEESFHGFYYQTVRISSVHLSPCPPQERFEPKIRANVVMGFTYLPFVDRTLVNGSKVWDGFAVHVMRQVAAKLHFSFEIEEETMYGGIEPDGSWNGMVGHVQRQEADMAVSGLTITAQRETVVDFSYPFWYEPAAVVIQLKSREISYLFKPMKSEVWLSILGTAVISSIVTALWYGTLAQSWYSRWQGRTVVLHGGENSSAPESNMVQSQQGTTNPTRDHKYISWDWLLYGFTIWLAQSGARRPKAQFVRTVVSCVLLAVVVLSATYSGNLIASLAVQTPKLPFDTLEQLAADTEYTLLVWDGTSHRTLLETSKGGVYKRLWKKIESQMPSSLCHGGQECIDRFTSDSKVAKIGDFTEQLVDYIPASNCRGVILPETYFPSGFGFAIPERSPYKRFIDTTIKQMAESGILLHYEKRFWPRDECEQRRKDASQTRPLTISDVLITFIILVAGLSAATVSLSVEMCARYLFDGRGLWFTEQKTTKHS